MTWMMEYEPKFFLTEDDQINGRRTGQQKSLGYVLHVLQYCRTTLGLLQRCCRPASDLLQIIKAQYLDMLHAKFEVSSLNSMAVRETIRLD